MSTELNIEPAFALATMIQETGWFTSDLWINANNPSGIVCTYGECYDGYQTYSTKEAGIKATLNLIHQYVYDYDLKTIGAARELWCQTEDAEQIVQLMEKITKEK